MCHSAAAGCGWDLVLARLVSEGEFNAHNPEQMKNAIDTARAAVSSQTEVRIGRNPVLRNMYGQSAATDETTATGPGGCALK